MSALSPWIDQFSKKHKSILSLVRGAVSQGLPKTKTYTDFKAKGLGVAKQAWFNMWNDVARAYTNPDTYLDQTNMRSKPIPELVPISLGRQAKAYSYTVSFNSIDGVTGLEKVKHLTIASTNLIETFDIYQMTSETANAYGFEEDVDLESMRIESVTFNENPIFRV
jgi:hypothetical protein